MLLSGVHQLMGVFNTQSNKSPTPCYCHLAKPVNTADPRSWLSDPGAGRHLEVWHEVWHEASGGVCPPASPTAKYHIHTGQSWTHTSAEEHDDCKFRNKARSTLAGNTITGIYTLKLHAVSALCGCTRGLTVAILITENSWKKRILCCVTLFSADIRLIDDFVPHQSIMHNLTWIKSPINIITHWIFCIVWHTVVRSRTPAWEGVTGEIHPAWVGKHILTFLYFHSF